MLTATLNINQVNEALDRFVARLDDPRPFLKIWGQRTAKQARTTARSKGGRRFWSDVARSVRVVTVAHDTVSVHTKHVAAAQKQFGGEIRPKDAKALTIPISDEAKGKRASEFEGGGRELFVLDRQDGPTVGILGYADEDSFHALFVLRTKSNPPADPWWPTDGQVARYGLEEGGRFVQDNLNRI